MKLPSPKRLWRRWQRATQIEIRCRSVFHGTRYGGWTICEDRLSARPIVYSFGIGTDISFDLAMIEQYGAEVHAFDPVPRSIQWVRDQSIPESFIVHDYGIANEDGEIPFFPPKDPQHISHSTICVHDEATASLLPVKQWQSILDELNHSRIDVLKIDIEGTEYSIIDDILSSTVSIDQILLEFHHFMPGITYHQTHSTIKKIRRAGYRLAFISDRGYEYSWVKSDAS